jgi:hypothetical protein
MTKERSLLTESNSKSTSKQYISFMEWKGLMDASTFFVLQHEVMYSVSQKNMYPHCKLITHM